MREDVFPALNVPKAQIARDLRVSRQQLYDILNEKKPVTPQMALRLAKLLGTSAESWLRMQHAYDLAMQAPAMPRNWTGFRRERRPDERRPCVNASPLLPSPRA